ncbi:hypothetical protein NECAME_02847 [Necator americanus]|uniref:Uncharacterized protein n=1 Tax=Necator americanus TaxID=51031 RepID=W2TAT2_NECAM|nr:hypothetical protein NECAME_02847 [Necator americanus]ETN78699.1 hypothetical protein NECAME_02847 [Necator americanus]
MLEVQKSFMRADCSREGVRIWVGWNKKGDKNGKVKVLNEKYIGYPNILDQRRSKNLFMESEKEPMCCGTLTDRSYEIFISD